MEEKIYPFTRLGFTKEELEKFSVCVDMGISEGIDHIICLKVKEIIDEAK